MTTLPICINNNRSKDENYSKGHCPNHSNHPSAAAGATKSARPSVTFSLALEEIDDGFELAENGEQGGQRKKYDKKKMNSSSISSNGYYCYASSPRVKFLVCCVSVPLMGCARFVGWLSTVPLILSVLLLPFAPSAMVDLIPELMFLGVELVCVLALFFGLQQRQANYLRPFLFFGVFWNMLLLLLLLFSVIELLVARDRFCEQIMHTIQGLLMHDPAEEQRQINRQLSDGPATAYLLLLDSGDEQFGKKSGKTNSAANVALTSSPAFALCLSVFLVFLLALTILIDGWLLNIVLLAYFHLKKAEEQRDKHKLLYHWIYNGSEIRQGLLAASKNKKKHSVVSNYSSTTSTTTTTLGGGLSRDEKLKKMQQQIEIEAKCNKNNGHYELDRNGIGNNKNIMQHSGQPNALPCIHSLARAMAT